MDTIRKDREIDLNVSFEPDLTTKVFNRVLVALAAVISIFILVGSV